MKPQLTFLYLFLSLPLFNSAQPQLNSGNPAKALSLPAYNIGMATNGFFSQNFFQNQVFADPSSGAVAIIHFQDITVWGGGVNSMGLLRYGYSTDQGQTWLSEIGPIQPITQAHGKYPQISGFNPLESGNPLETQLVWSTTTDGDTANAPGHFFGSLPLSMNTSTTHFVELECDSLIPGNLCKGAFGDFWQVDLMMDTATWIADTLVLFKGEWNAVSQDVDWSIHQKIGLGVELGFDGKSRVLNPAMGFSPDGQHGWIGFAADISESMAPMGQDSFAYAPCFLHSTDSGATWSSVNEINLNSISWVRDTLLNGPQNSLGQPLANGIAGTGTDFDLVVDVNGDVHFGIVIGNSSMDYSLIPNQKKFLAHIYSENSGGSFDCKYMSPVHALNADRLFLTDTLPSVYGNCIQATINPDYDHIYFTWVDTDSCKYGNYGNAFPDLQIAGSAINGYTMPRKDLSADDILWSGRVLYPQLAPVAFESGGGGINHIPLVFTDWLASCRECRIDLFFMNHINQFYLSDFAGHTDYLNTLISYLPADCPPVGNIAPTLAGLGIQILQGFPNPATDEIQVSIEVSDGVMAKLEIVSVTGKVVKRIALKGSSDEIQTVKLEVSDLSAGYYSCILRSGTSQSVWRFAKYR